MEIELTKNEIQVIKEALTDQVNEIIYQVCKNIEKRGDLSKEEKNQLRIDILKESLNIKVYQLVRSSKKIKITIDN